MAHLRTPVFLSRIDYSPSDRRLAFERNSSGVSVLHWIARHLWQLAKLDFPPDELQELLNLGVSVLKNGADPCNIAFQESEYSIRNKRFFWDAVDRKELCQTKPLMDCLDCCNLKWYLKLDRKSWLRRTLRCIYYWAEIIRRADIDLCDYGTRESDIWRSLGFPGSTCHSTSEYRQLEIGRLVYGPKPTDWSLEVRFHRPCWVYGLRPPPGAFVEEYRLPT